MGCTYARRPLQSYGTSRGALGAQVRAQQRGLVAVDERRVQLVHVDGRQRVKRIRLGPARQLRRRLARRPKRRAQPAAKRLLVCLYAHKHTLQRG